MQRLVPLLEEGVALEVAGNLNHVNATNVANVTKCVANLAEHTQGRKQLYASALEKLRPLAASAEPLVSKMATIAVAKVEWMP